MEKILEMKKVKEGYKQTSIGVIPEEWNISKLGRLSKIGTGSKDNKDKSDVGIYPFFVRSKNIERINTFSYDGEAILIPGEGKIGEIFHYIIGKFDFHQRVYKVSDFENGISGKYIYYYLQNFFIKETIRNSVKATVDSLRLPTFTEMLIHLPSFHEQQKIAAILSTWDEAISKQKSLVELTKTRNQGLARQLLSGKKRLKGFNGEWKFSILSKVVNRVKNSFIPEQNELYQQIGIRSHTKGLFYKEPVSGKELGNKSVFWIEPNCFVVNIVFAWEHAIAKTTTNEIGMIASHRFPMFKPKKDLLDLDYMLNYFKSPKGKDLLGLASPGGAGRNKTLGQAEFLKLPILLPSTDEQKAISKVIEQANIELQKLEQQLILLQNEKKGLMQKLLTGEVRVKIN